jgi:RimJ/RimL family protein N-acetyltransferase
MNATHTYSGDTGSLPGIPDVTLSDGRIRLRPLVPADVDALHAAVLESKAELQPWMPWCHANYSRQDTEGYLNSRAAEWANDTDYSFKIEDAITGQLLGGVGLNFITRAHQFANLGYWVRTSATRKGIASSAVRLMAHFGFAELKFHRLEIVAAVGNVPSQRAAEKAGAHRHATLRNRLWLNGRAHDAVMYSLIPQDLPAT